MSKMVLLTSLHLLGFRESVGGNNKSIDIREGLARKGDMTVELKIGTRFEVNAIIGCAEGKVSCPVWVLDYEASKTSTSPSGGGQDLWKMAIVMDEVFNSYAEAHVQIVEITDHLMSELESPTAFSTQKLAEIY